MNRRLPRQVSIYSRRTQRVLQLGPREETLTDYDRYLHDLVQHGNPADALHFAQHLRNMAQQQRVHFDMGGGDGMHIRSWRLEPHPFDQDGAGDNATRRRPIIHPLMFELPRENHFHR